MDADQDYVMDHVEEDDKVFEENDQKRAVAMMELDRAQVNFYAREHLGCMDYMMKLVEEQSKIHLARAEMDKKKAAEMIRLTRDEVHGYAQDLQTMELLDRWDSEEPRCVCDPIEGNWDDVVEGEAGLTVLGLRDRWDSETTFCGYCGKRIEIEF